MKTHVEVSSSRRKSRRAHFAAPSNIRWRLMSTHLSKELRAKHSVRAIPIRQDDEVLIVRGLNKGQKGKVVQVVRKNFTVTVEKLTKTKANGAPFNLQFHPSNLVLTKIKLDKDRNDLLRRKAAGLKQDKGAKHTTETTRKVD